MGPDDFERIRAPIDRIVASVRRQHHMTPPDGEDFRQHVYLEIIKNDYAVLRKFEGRSEPSTYLTTVIQRLYYQYRYKEWGKWRPSAEAKRLGKKAILLEQMLTRDGYTLDEAIKILTTRTDSQWTKEEIEDLYAKLPIRQARTTFIPGEDVPDPPAPDQTDGPVMHLEREEKARSIRKALDDAIHTLAPEDQTILNMRFHRGMKVSEIAAVLHLDAKKLYKHIDALLRVLAKEMIRAGVDRDDVRDILWHHDLDDDPENGPSGPSQDNDGDLGEGTGRRGDDDDDD